MRRALLRSSAGSALLLLVLYPAPTQASERDKLTYFTFSGPVQVPGATLEAGTYEFRLVNPDSGGSVIHVQGRDGAKVSRLFFMIRGSRQDETSDSPIVVLLETPAGTPPALQGWFYPGEESGFEFVYSRRQARAINGGADRQAAAGGGTTRIVVGSTAPPAVSARNR
jgi:hypothetical protein